MSVRSTHHKIVGTAGAAALAVSALASPALADGTASVAYSCTATGGTAHPSAVYTTASAPATMAVGQPLDTTAEFTLDAGTTALAVNLLGWTKFKGTATTKSTASKAGLDISIPKTTLGNGTAGSTVAQATGSVKAGSTVKDSFTFALGDIGHVVLTGYNKKGKKLGSVRFPSASNGPCTNDATTTILMDGGNPVVTQTVKDKSSTKESASYAAKKKVAKSTAKVKARYGTAATGKVKFTLKKGTHKIKTISDKLNKKGVASVSFKNVKAKGKYSIVAKYAGSDTLKGSKGKDTFKV